LDLFDGNRSGKKYNTTTDLSGIIDLNYSAAPGGEKSPKGLV
jgi:hypothetical protein